MPRHFTPVRIWDFFARLAGKRGLGRDDYHRFCVRWACREARAEGQGFQQGMRQKLVAIAMISDPGLF
jgi:hypothetical protein